MAAIDLTRFACALLVVAYHFGFAYGAAPSARTAAALAGAGTVTAWPVARAGLVGVDLFFVISGLVIARSAAESEWRGFLWRRVLRLAPAAWLCATLTFAVLAASGQGDPALAVEWRRSMLFWPIGRQIDGSYWTLSVECAFYFLVAAIAVGNRRRLEALGWALALASGGFWLACALRPDAGDALATNQAAILFLLPHGCLFAAGIAIDALGRRVTAIRLALLTLAVAGGMAEIALHVDGWHATPALMLAEGGFASGVAVLLGAGRLQGRIGTWLSEPIARRIGLMTYPLYLLHQEIGAVLTGLLIRAGVPLPVALTMTLAAILALAWAIATRAEPIFRRALNTLVSPRRAPAPDSLRNASLPVG